MIRLIPFFPAIFVLLWSTGFIGARYAMPHAEPFTFLTLRYVGAIAILLPLIVLARAPWPGRQAAGHAAIAGALLHGAYLGGVFYAVRNGLPAGTVALIVGLQPLLTALMASGFLGERLSARHWGGLALGFAGILLVVAPQMGSDASYGLDAVTPALIAALGISVGTIWQKRFVGDVDLRTGTCLQYLGALVPTLVLAVLLETGSLEWTGELVFALVWLTLVLSIGAVLLLVFLIREGAVSRVASLMYLTPGVTAVLAYGLFGEELTPLQLFGLCLAAAGVALCTSAAARRSGR